MENVLVPKSLVEMVRYFSDPDVCIEFVAAMRWVDGIAQCPHCGKSNAGFLKTRRIWKCRECRKQFSVKTDSIFEESPIGLDKWLAAIWLVVNCKNGISSYEIARDLKVTQKTAWFLLHRIRLALKNGSWAKLGGTGGPVEVDETFIGGKPKNMHASRRLKLQTSQNGYAEKAIVVGMLDRDTRQVRAKLVPNVKRETLQKEVLSHIGHGATVYTDGWPGYDGLKKAEFVHETVTHIEEYVRGNVHTQGIENFWSLSKRGLNGTYVCVEPFHMDAYLDEQMFRFNNRATRDNPLDDGDRFMLAVSQVAGRRLTYAELTGKVSTTQA
jgi:transposase-like protein